MQLQKSLCQQLCPHFKPAKEDTLACRGFLVIERLIQRGMDIPFEKPLQWSSPGNQEELMRTLCPVCPFYEDDCDFAQRQEGALPCGGFLLLGELINRKIISIDIIKEIR